MATYVMSDIHGEYDRFEKMLELINPGDDDRIYVIGDVVDRGKEGINIVQHIMKSNNITLILGNHEFMFLQYFKDDTPIRTKRNWNRNGNFHTLMAFDELSEDEQTEMLEYLENCPDYAELEIDGNKFYLAHGFTGEDRYHRVWGRPKEDAESGLPDDVTLIIGHTPVCEYICPGTDEQIYVYSYCLTEKGEHFKILHAEHFIDIDCGVGYGMSAARLACMRLEDGMEFYV